MEADRKEMNAQDRELLIRLDERIANIQTSLFDEKSSIKSTVVEINNRLGELNDQVAKNTIGRNVNTTNIFRLWGITLTVLTMLVALCLKTFGVF